MRRSYPTWFSSVSNSAGKYRCSLSRQPVVVLLVFGLLGCGSGEKKEMDGAVDVDSVVQPDSTTANDGDIDATADSGLGLDAEAQADAEPIDAGIPIDGILDQGVSLVRNLYDYAPSVMLDTDGLYKMWWCGEDPSQLPNIVDVIYYAESTDGFNWSTPTMVLESAGPPHQGIWACDPSVVKASNGYYYMFYTSEGHLMGDNQIFLAWSADGFQWDYTNGGQPVIPLLNPDGSYGIGQSSVLYLDLRFLQFYTDTSGGSNKTYVAESTNGGTVFNKLNNGNPVLNNVTAVDAKYLPTYDMYLVAAEGPFAQWKLSFYLLSSDFQVLASIEPAPGAFSNPCNHNPGMLGDPAGVAVNENAIPVYFGSGTYDTSNPTPCWNPSSWDIHSAIFFTDVLLNPGP